MGKQRTSNAATRTPEQPGKPSSTPKKRGSEINESFIGKNSKKLLAEKDEVSKKFGKEIDDIFSGKKRKKTEAEKEGDDVGTKSKKVQKKNPPPRNEGPRDINRSGDKVPNMPRKKTGDGLVIYTEDELGIGKGDAGGTRLCPFDCDCCF